MPLDIVSGFSGGAAPTGAAQTGAPPVIGLDPTVTFASLLTGKATDSPTGSVKKSGGGGDDAKDDSRNPRPRRKRLRPCWNPALVAQNIVLPATPRQTILPQTKSEPTVPPTADAKAGTSAAMDASQVLYPPPGERKSNRRRIAFHSQTNDRGGFPKQTRRRDGANRRALRRLHAEDGRGVPSPPSRRRQSRRPPPSWRIRRRRPPPSWRIRRRRPPPSRRIRRRRPPPPSLLKKRPGEPVDASATSAATPAIVAALGAASSKVSESLSEAEAKRTHIAVAGQSGAATQS